MSFDTDSDDDLGWVEQNPTLTIPLSSSSTSSRQNAKQPALLRRSGAGSSHATSNKFERPTRGKVARRKSGKEEEESSSEEMGGGLEDFIDVFTTAGKQQPVRMVQAVMAAEEEHAKPSHAKPSHAKPSHAKPSHAKPSHAKPSDAKPSHAKPSHAKPSQAPPEDRELAPLPIIDSSPNEFSMMTDSDEAHDPLSLTPKSTKSNGPARLPKPDEWAKAARASSAGAKSTTAKKSAALQPQKVAKRGSKGALRAAASVKPKRTGQVPSSKQIKKTSSSHVRRSMSEPTNTSTRDHDNIDDPESLQLSHHASMSSPARSQFTGGSSPPSSGKRRGGEPPTSLHHKAQSVLQARAASAQRLGMMKGNVPPRSTAKTFLQATIRSLFTTVDKDLAAAVACVVASKGHEGVGIDSRVTVMMNKKTMGEVMPAVGDTVRFYDAMVVDGVVLNTTVLEMDKIGGGVDL